MKVLFLSTWFPYPPDNGSKLRVFHLLKALARKHRVTLCSFAFDAAQPEQAEPLASFCDTVVTVHRNPFVRGRWAGASRFLSPMPIVDAPLLEMQHHVSALLEQKCFALVIASTTVTATYALQAAHAAKVLEEHNCHTRWAWDRYQGQASAVARLRAWVNWRKRRSYDARLYAQFDLCTMVSEQDRASGLQLLGDRLGRLEVVPNGVDCQHNHPGLAEPQPGVLVYNGALTYSANYDAMQYFLSAIYPLVQREEPGVSLAITGSTSGVDLSRLRLDDSVRLTGYVEDVRPVMAGASVCVVPLRQGGGTRLKILEAMALGTPVVATSKAAEGLDVTPGRDLLIADAPSEFAMAVIRLLSLPFLRESLARNARLLVQERYDWQAIGDRFTHLVEEVAHA